MVTEGLWDVADVIYLQRIHGDLFGAVVDEVEFSAFVQGTSELSFPLCGIRFINSLLELPGLHSPCLEGAFTQNGGIKVTILSCLNVFIFLHRIHISLLMHYVGYLRKIQDNG